MKMAKHLLEYYGGEIGEKVEGTVPGGSNNIRQSDGPPPKHVHTLTPHNATPCNHEQSLFLQKWTWAARDWSRICS